jgi:hypothetical protein
MKLTPSVINADIGSIGDDIAMVTWRVRKWVYALHE